MKYEPVRGKGWIPGVRALSGSNRARHAFWGSYLVSVYFLIYEMRITEPPSEGCREDEVRQSSTPSAPALCDGTYYC